MIYTQLDIEEFKGIAWNSRLVFWIGLAIFMYVLRHLFYAWRLKVLSYHKFSWAKAIELIFIWEFSTAISPTSIGGSAVALFFLVQERIKGAQTVAMVLYSVVADTVFFIVSLIGLYLGLGAVMIRPGASQLSDLDGLGITFIGIIAFMTVYGAVFFYGLFIDPAKIRSIFLWIAKMPVIKRFGAGIRQTALDMEASSAELRSQNWQYHIQVWIATGAAWMVRFFAINFIIIGLVAASDYGLYDHLVMYARGEAMYAITAFSPTPGAAGIAEIVFGGFYSDYISEGLSSFAALIWRLISYYSYLIAGAIIIPIWIRKIMNYRKVDK